MGDSDNEKSDQGETGRSQQEQDLKKKIRKEIDKLKFYLEEGDELLENCDYSEIALTCKRTDEIQDLLNDLMSTLQDLKIDRGISTQREVRQWKNDLKATYTPLLGMKTRLSKVLEERERSKTQKAEEEKLRAKFEQEEQFRREMDPATREGTLGRKDESGIENGGNENRDGKSRESRPCEATGAQDNPFQRHFS